MGGKGSKSIEEDFDTRSYTKKLVLEDKVFERLTRYFYDIEERVLMVRTDKDVKDAIVSAAEEFIDSLLKEMAAMDDRIKTSRDGIIKVGSYFEGTDIICMDRIQYYIVMNDVSEKNIAAIRSLSADPEAVETTDESDVEEAVVVDEENKDLVSVYIKDSLSLRWQDCIEEEYSNHKLRSETGFLQLFYDSAEKATASLRRKFRDKIFRNQGRFEMQVGSAISISGSTVRLKFTWNEELPITVELTPVLKSNKDDSHLSKDDPITKILYDTVQSSGLFLLVPIVGTGNNFRWSYVHTEVHMMKKVLLKAHVRTYRLLLFFVYGYQSGALDDVTIFDDRVLKMLVFRHDHQCVCADQIADCVMSILHEMQQILKTDSSVFLPSIFNQRQNMLIKKLSRPSEEVLKLNQAALERLTNHLLNDVSRDPRYDFEEAMKRFVPINEFILRGDYTRRKSASVHRARRFVEV